MANPLDWAARAILQLNGMSPEEITKRARLLKAGRGNKPMPKANTTRSATTSNVKPAVRQTRVNGRLVQGSANRSYQAGKPKQVRQGPRTSNVKQQVEIRQSPRSAQKADGPMGPQSRYTPRSQQAPDGQIPSKNVRRLQEAAKRSNSIKPSTPASAKPAASTQAPRPSTSPIRLPNASANGAPPRARSAANGLDIWRERGGAPQSRSARLNAANTPKPQAQAPKPPQPGSTQVGGQTNLFSKNGQPRDFRNPRVAANRPPTTTPVQTRSSAQATPPNRPAGGFGNRPQGQGNLFGNQPNAKPSGNYRAPNVPGAGSATKPQPTASQRANERWVNENTRAARERLARIGDVTARIRPVTTPGTIGTLALSNFGNEGESADVRARRLGFRDAADQKARIAAQQRAGNTKQTAEQAIAAARAAARRNPNQRTPQTNPNTRNSPAAVNTPQYRRPAANVSRPSAAQRATDARDKRKLF